MLGINKISNGRMGNRLFHYHFLRQISKKTNIDYFHPSLPDCKYFEDMQKKKKPFYFFKKRTTLTSRDILGFKSDNFIDYLKSEDKKDKNVIFDPPMLGEVFFDYLFYPPSDFIKIKKEFKINFNFNSSGKKIVGLHFRGTDFKAWNENASLKFDYYKNSIEYCIQFFNKQNLVFVLFTDDLEFETFKSTVNFLNLLKVEFYISDNKRPAIFDFYQMSECDVLVSSPSTFAIFAGCLGKQKKIIHAKSWLDYAVEQNDTFWIKLKTTDNKFYSIWKIF